MPTLTDIALPLYPKPVRDPHCTGCDLHEGVTSVCVPTVLFGHEGPDWPRVPHHERAVLIVGEAPGQKEDEAGRPFVGKAGKMLRECYIDFFDLPSRADIYLSNAVRCRPPQNATPSKTQMKACQGFLLEDIRRLQQRYREVIILATGAPALMSLTGSSLQKWLARQGSPANFDHLIGKSKKYRERAEQIVEGPPIPCPVFATYHPAYLLRQPSQALSVCAHLQQMVDYMDGVSREEISEDLEIAVAPNPPAYPVRRLSLDCETYGFFRDGPPQTQFHPIKMETYDGVSREDILRTVGLSWRDEGGDPHHAIFMMRVPAHRRKLWAWLRKIRQDEGFEFLVGHNLSFDLPVLRHCYPECRAWLDYPLPVMDTIITNSLHDEGRPEKSLKNLSPLFGITKYKEEAEQKRFWGDRDKRAWQYQCQDTYATLLLQERLEDEIRRFYGDGTQKLSPFCYRWYSELLWLIVWMTETGVALSEDRIHKLFEAAKKREEAILSEAWDKYGLPLKGKGSQKALRDLVGRSLEAIDDAGLDRPDLELTDKTKAVSFKAENRNALLNTLRQDHGAPAAFSSHPTVLDELELVGEYQDNSKLLNSYLYPLTEGRGKDHTDRGTCMINGIVYPKWFPVPSEYEDGVTGGTKQSRLACSGPSIPTFPKTVKRGIMGRFPGGYRTWADYSQIELRVAALLSNDAVMMEEYQGKPDLHSRTAKLIFGDDIVDHPEFKSKYRQAGKTLNFLVLYRGGAAKFQETLLRDIGIDFPLRKCQDAIDNFWQVYKGLIEWQESVIEFVRRHEYFELPLIGNSRLFLGGRKARDAAVNEVVNIPIQAVAAVITQSAQFSLWSRFKAEQMKALVPINIYDSVFVECPKLEIYGVRRAITEIMPSPPYYEALCDHLGRRLPLEIDIDERRILGN